MKMSMISAISAIGISKLYGKTPVLQDVSLTLNKGECLALVGHNGAGKSTLIKILLGLTKSSAGQIQIMGQDVSSHRFQEQRKKIGFLPEQILFQKNMTGREVLGFYARLKNAPRSQIAEMFEKFGLEKAADQRLATYSKGMRQKLGMAQALLGDPQFLVLDEPTSGLDPLARQNMYQILDEEKRKGTSILISSHVLTEIDERVDRIQILNSGKVIADGTLSCLSQNRTVSSKIQIEATPEACQQIASIFSHELKIIRPTTRTLTLYCEQARKVTILNTIYALGIEFTDIRISDPSLEETFSTYMKSEREGYHD